MKRRMVNPLVREARRIPTKVALQESTNLNSYYA